MKVGDLIQHRRIPAIKGLPVGLVVDVTYKSGGDIWCDILWDDGTTYGAWDSELMEAVAV